MGYQFRKEVESWPIETIDECLKNWTEFENNGVIGSCMLREKATEISQKLTGTSITLWMRDIAFECWRRKAIDLGYKEN